MNIKTSNTDFVQQVFSEVPKTYELTNHVLTLGMDTLWRKQSVKLAAATARPGRWADICTGTGETAAYLRKTAGPETEVFAIDFSEPMMTEARKKTGADKINFVLADAKALPFPDNHFDLLTISFATRNINLNRETLISTFAEFLRVLKPGGFFFNLETSQPNSRMIRNLFHLYIKLCVRRIGAGLSGSDIGYSYLSKTIPRFYSAEELKEIMTQAGFPEVKFKLMMFGTAAIHIGAKH